jgi:hypothetical protein
MEPRLSGLALNEATAVEKRKPLRQILRYHSKLAWFVFFLAGVVTIMIILVCVLLAEFAMVKSQSDSLQQQSRSQNGQLSSISEQQLHFSGLQAMEEAKSRVSFEQLSHAVVGQHKPHPTSSCDALPSSAPSGYYWIRLSNGSALHVYCDMTRTCGGITGGWMRVANVKSTIQCPDNLAWRTRLGFCRVDYYTPSGCTLVTIPTYNFNYSHVCGRIRGHLIGRPDAFLSTNFSNPYYVDGISLTHGDPREHIWTFAAADRVMKCPCGGGNPPPPEVGNDYFCDTAEHRDAVDRRLWLGDCQTPNECCSFNNPPWFYRQLSQPTTDDIEMRVCRDGRYGEVVFKEQDIYVQ